ncbi:MAG: division/cell wall cluster transcriptional repressor MraZ [Bacteroidales bacterium]|nr:division/cell wall cluster transcriptional repressor MraZ [Bacteroidales bacterium]
MTTFIGDYPCKVDVKGRILLPSAFKRQMGTVSQDRFVVKKDLFENCLVLYPIDEWEKQNKIIRKKLNPYNKEHNRFLRGFYKGTAEITLDNNNRMLIPKRLLELITANKEVVLAGQDGKIEIWSKQQYEKINENENEFAALAEKIMEGAINEINE